MRNYTQISGTGQSWDVATEHLLYHSGNNSLYSFGTQYSTMRAVRLDATTGSLINAWDPYGQGYQATSGTPGYSPVQLPDGRLLMVGTRDSAGWLAVLNEDLSRGEEYVYNGSQPFIGIISYDASNWLVIGAYSTNPSTSYFYLISKSNYSIVAAYQAITSFGVPSHVRGLAIGPDGVVYLAYRQNMFALVDIPNMVVRARDYGNPMWRIPVGPGSTGQTTLREFSSPKTAMSINPVSKMVVAFYAAGYTASTYGPSDAHRVMTLAMGLSIPPGTYVLDTDPPLNRTLTATVTGTTTALTTRVLPIGTPIPDPDAGRAVPTLLAGTFTPNFQPVTTGTFEYELQSASVCPPKFWTSRLDVPLYSGIGDPHGGTVVDAAGNNYSAMRWADPGGTNVDSGILLTKRDKDGKILWQKKTAATPTFSVFKMWLTSEGVMLSWITGTFSGNNRLWHVNADGTQRFAAVYGNTPQGTYSPLNLLAYDTATDQIIAVHRYQSNSYFGRYSGSTGTLTHCVLVDIGNPLSPPIKLDNGNYVVCGLRDSKGWILEFKPDFAQSTNFAASVVQSYVYTGTSTTGFKGMCKYGNNWVVVDSSANIYLLSATDYSVVIALKPRTATPGVGGEVRAMTTVSADSVLISWRGNTLLWDLNIPARLGAARKQDFSSSIFRSEERRVGKECVA
jgi:hypothetical protein